MAVKIILFVTVIGIAGALYPSTHSKALNGFKTLKHSTDILPDGSYSYEYETENGIVVSESGHGGQKVEGSVQWITADGTPIQFTYVADETGFHPTGSHIPPVPQHVLQSLKYIRTHVPAQKDEPLDRVH